VKIVTWLPDSGRPGRRAYQPGLRLSVSSLARALGLPLGERLTVLCAYRVDATRRRPASVRLTECRPPEMMS
jgi:hypothetical protein